MEYEPRMCRRIQSAEQHKARKRFSPDMGSSISFGDFPRRGPGGVWGTATGRRGGCEVPPALSKLVLFSFEGCRADSRRQNQRGGADSETLEAGKRGRITDV